MLFAVHPASQKKKPARHRQTQQRDFSARAKAFHRLLPVSLYRLKDEPWKVYLFFRLLSMGKMAKKQG